MHGHLNDSCRWSMSSIEGELRKLLTKAKLEVSQDNLAIHRVRGVVEHHAIRLMRRFGVASGHKDADDLAQEWFLIWLSEGASRYGHYEPLYPVAYIILFRLCASHARKLRPSELATELSDTQGGCPVMTAHRRDLVERSRRAIDMLPHKHKLAVRLRYYDGAGSVEAARLLGVSTGRLHGLTHEARRMLLTHLSKDGVTAADL